MEDEKFILCHKVDSKTGFVYHCDSGLVMVVNLETAKELQSEIKKETGRDVIIVELKETDK